jgi:hypothetical protein
VAKPHDTRERVKITLPYSAEKAALLRDALAKLATVGKEMMARMHLRERPPRLDS